MNYAIVKNNEIIEAPVAMRSTWNGIKNFNDLSADELKKHGWYPCEILNFSLSSDDLLFVSETYFDGQKVIINYDKTIKDIEVLKKQKKDENAAKRYEKEISGIFYEGHFFLTERESVNVMNAAMEKIRRGLTTSISWKCGDGSYIDLNNENILNIELVILTHIQTSFETEKAYNEAIEATTTIEELNAINLIY